MIRKNDGQWIQKHTRLFKQNIVNMYAKIEEQRLNFILFNKSKIRSDSLCGIQDAISRGDCDFANICKRIYLPGSFIGSPRHMYQLYQDSISIVRDLGKPYIFITFSCNPYWPEI